LKIPTKIESSTAWLLVPPNGLNAVAGSVERSAALSAPLSTRGVDWALLSSPKNPARLASHSGANCHSRPAE
jgi:hypothetical protein